MQTTSLAARLSQTHAGKSQLSVDAFRALQYKAAPDFPLGVWGPSFFSSAPVLSCRAVAEAVESEEALQRLPSRRSLCLARAADLQLADLSRLLKRSDAVLLLLPPQESDKDATTAAVKAHVQTLEREIVNAQSAAAVFFAWETSELAELLRRLEQRGSSDKTRLQPSVVPLRASNASAPRVEDGLRRLSRT